MKNRLVLVLLSITAVMQGVILYRQYTNSGSVQKAVISPIRDARADTLVDLQGLPVKGSQTSDVVLIEFGDYECPFCEKHARDVGKQLEARFVSTGQIRYAFAHLPLDIHPNAKHLAAAAVCAGLQGKYWDMHDRLFSDKPKTSEAISIIVRDIGLESGQFQLCLDLSADPGMAFKRDMATAARLGLEATPAFAIGKLEQSGQVRIAKFVVGAAPINIFQEAIGSVVGN